MMKRTIAAILMLAMLITLCPVIPAYAADAEIIATGVTGGTYTDLSARADEGYEYVITGSDGSEYTLTTYAMPENTGNAVIGTDDAHYEVMNNSMIPLEGKYIIVGAHSGGGKSNYNMAINGNSTLSYTEVSPVAGVIEVADESAVEYIWTVTKVNTVDNVNYYTFESKYGKYLDITATDSANGVALADSANNAHLSISANTQSTYRNTWSIGKKIGNGTGYLNNYTNGKIGAYREPDGGSALFLYRYVNGYTVSTLGLEALVALVDPEINYLKQTDYTTASWNTFKASLATAESLIAQMSTQQFTTKTAADAALATVDNAYVDLYNKIINLDVNVTKDTSTGVVTAGQNAVPAIVWQRTKENAADVVTNLQHIGNDMSIIDWHFGSTENEDGSSASKTVSSLTTDPTTIMWDYGDLSSWYGRKGSETAVDELRASTWKEFGTENSWKHSSVRLLSGEFIWPEGYDFDDTVVIASSEDHDYNPIYEYINSQPALKEVYAGQKVIPVNDDIYFFVRREGEVLTEENYLDHLVFWTGTSGKGLWSSATNNRDDWGRTTPATFHGTSALPAFYETLPNLRHIDNDASFSHVQNSTPYFAQMVHADKWFAMADTNAFMSTMRALYGNAEDPVEAGDKIIVDVYAFDNDGYGGMDPLEVRFVKNPEETATVTVNYYLNEVTNEDDSEHYIGSGHLTGIVIGQALNLSLGTGVGQLNNMKTKAADKAGVPVSNGVQVNKSYVVQEGNNVINVVYKLPYTYDFGMKNLYTFNYDGFNIPDDAEFSFDNITNATTENLKVVTSNKPGEFNFTFDVPDSLGRPVSATVKAKYDNGNTEIQLGSIYIYPASNVLYEEKFISISDKGYVDWKKTDAGALTVSDNNDSVYGYTDAYSNSTGQNGAYSVNLTAENIASDDLTFDFYGTGFDLIGTCGPDTGTLMVRVNDMSGNYIKGYIVDTAFTDENYGTIYQVPIINENALNENFYKITIRGLYVEYPHATSQKSTRSGLSDETYYQLMEQMLDMGFTEDDMEDVEFINMEQQLKESGANSRQVRADGTVKFMTLEIDGFRVYSSTDKDYFVADEKNLIYTNVMDCVAGALAAYIEGGTELDEDGNPLDVDVKQYESKGGPQNEIYLEPGQAIAFQLSDSASYAQISARCVGSDTVEMAMNTRDNNKFISHNTEMYYEVDVQSVTEEDTTGKIIVVGNIGNNGLLALGNIKSNGTIIEISNKALSSATRMVRSMMYLDADDTESDLDDKDTTEPTEPDESVPKEPVPEESVPEESVPEESVPEESVPEESVPEESVPEESVPKESVPEESVPEESVPEESVPEESVPEESVPEESVPEESKPDDSEDEEDDDVLELPFKDVKKGDWFYEGVAYAYFNELMNGMKVDEFAPNSTMTRAMVATVLHRLAGSPETQYDAGYTDVESGRYYSDAVNWAAENEIVFGIGNDLFDPNGDVTREQLATILYRYSDMMGYDLETDEDLADFPDADDVSSWSVDGIKWAVGKGIINGVKNGDLIELKPSSNAMRSQIAVMLQRFCELVY